MENIRIAYYEFGRPREVLKLEHCRPEPPGPGELLVRMKLSPINPSDLIPIRGAYAHRIALPAIPGYEGIGVVEETGRDIPQEWLGRRVLPLRGEGTWQQYVRVPADWAVRVPDAVDDDAAAQLYINPLTAWVTCTEELRLSGTGMTVLVNAGGSALGRVYAQLSQALGFRLIAVTRSARHTADLLRLGADQVIDTSACKLHDAVNELTGGRGADAAVDSIGGRAGLELAGCLRPGGGFLSLGLLSGEPIDWPELVRTTQADARLFHLRHWNRQVPVQAWQETFGQLLDLAAAGGLGFKSPAARYRLAEIHQAVQAAEAGAEGKIMLTIS
ncbi:NADPH:quinone reductase [Paenibacillus sp. UNCCL117]|uniref:zinc-dependent alcohol dehydrogenase family protein n=1 Tax=unclassified Paenibacillus TaxID=185978 RepID=UPI00089066B6|nr:MULTISPECIES: zinc-dependent alcohol dehydrogenase family protein [unclassified Paenibacillus]SDE41157.1 NADPH:quinone reductase [Paenibacillus sp. cl123]SFW65443.1 NADPH:quinone reductase [Paenibacillus sp. UNCCL117]